MRRLAVFGLAALALAGCSSTPDSSPAPVRLDDLNLTPYLDKACSLFDADQLADLGVARAASDQETTGAGCVLTPKDRAVPDVVFALQTRQSAPTTTGTRIAGYPAQEQHTGVYCTVRVVVAPSQQIMANARGENDCHMAETVATTAIASIKRLSP